MKIKIDEKEYNQFVSIRTKLSVIEGKLRAQRETQSNPYTLIRDLNNIMRGN